MDRSLKLKFALCIVISLGALYMLSPTLWALMNPDQADRPPRWMPNTAMKLGLDLQGGIHMVLGVDLDQVVVNQLRTYGRSFEKFAESKGIKDVKTEINAKNFELEIISPDVASKEKIGNFISSDFTVLEFVGESGNVFVTRLRADQETNVREKALDQSIETIRNRIDEFGVSEPIISKKGDSQILVQFPGANEPDRLKALIGQTAQLYFHIVPNVKDGNDLAKQRTQLTEWIAEAEKAGNYTRDSFKKFSEYRTKLNEDLKGKLPPDTFVAFEKKNDVNVVGKIDYQPLLLSSKNALSGEYIENANVSLEKSNGGFGVDEPMVLFQLNAVGTPLFGNLTRDNVGSYMAIVLDGNVKSYPMIQSAITEGSGRITVGGGGMDQKMQEAKDIAIVLRAGALPATIEVQEERLIGPSIGRDAIAAGNKSLVVAALVIFLGTWLYYGSVGLVANFVNVVNVAWIFALLGMFGATLTLPGIAGIVLTLGMAVDALVIIFERMREERRAGRSSRQVVELGFDKAFSAILDSNITTAIGAFVLYQYGTGSIRGFALTLLMGITVNVILATYFSKVLMQVWFYFRRDQVGLGMSRSELQQIEAAR